MSSEYPFVSLSVKNPLIIIFTTNQIIIMSLITDSHFCCSFHLGVTRASDFYLNILQVVLPSLIVVPSGMIVQRLCVLWYVSCSGSGWPQTDNAAMNLSATSSLSSITIRTYLLWLFFLHGFNMYKNDRKWNFINVGPRQHVGLHVAVSNILAVAYYKLLKVFCTDAGIVSLVNIYGLNFGYSCVIKSIIFVRNENLLQLSLIKKMKNPNVPILYSCNPDGQRF